MKPKIAEDVPDEVWPIFNDIKFVIENMPSRLHPPLFLFGVRLPSIVAVKHYIPHCHDVCDALAQFFPVVAHHGVVHTKKRGKEHRLDHAWLTLRDLDDWIIIDPWPLGVVSGPALFIQDYAFHFGQECSVVRNEEERTELWSVVEAMSLVVNRLERRSRYMGTFSPEAHAVGIMANINEALESVDASQHSAVRKKLIELLSVEEPSVESSATAAE